MDFLIITFMTFDKILKTIKKTKKNLVKKEGHPPPIGGKIEIISPS